MNSTIPTEDFYVVAREAGAENPSLPTWANHSSNPALLSGNAPLQVSRKDIPEVPGAWGSPQRATA